MDLRELILKSRTETLAQQLEALPTHLVCLRESNDVHAAIADDGTHHPLSAVLHDVVYVPAQHLHHQTRSYAGT